MATNYEYIKPDKATTNNIQLHVIKTDAHNIVMRSCMETKTFTQGGWYGINGGFFQPGSGNTTKNIALNDNEPLISRNIQDGGWRNGVGDACLVWNGTELNFWPRYITNDSIIPEPTRKWAQGGIGLQLGNSTFPNMPAVPDYASSRARTAICANLSAKKLYMIITPESTGATAENFKKAVEKYLYVPVGTEHTNVVGMMLDGGGSTAMRCADFSYDQGRALVQILAIYNTQ